MLDEEDRTWVNEWKKVDRKAKKRSTSSMFPMRGCSVCKCALESERIVEVLFQFYNSMIKHNYYPSRWITRCLDGRQRRANRNKKERNHEELCKKLKVL